MMEMIWSSEMGDSLVRVRVERRMTVASRKECLEVRSVLVAIFVFGFRTMDK